MATQQTTYIPKFAYPFSQKDKNVYKEKLGNSKEGNYLFTQHGFWHGGIHFEGDMLTDLKANEGIKCIADGELVAYRLNENYFDDGNGIYSTSFFLVRHKLEYPANNKLTFFSLYMHTAKKDEYNIIQNNSNQTNTNYYTIKKGDTLGQIARIYHTTVDKLRQDNNIADVNKIREGHVLIIKPFPSSQNTQSTQSNPSNPNFLVENPKFDEVVVLPTPKPISAGETLGLMGEYNVEGEKDIKCLHLEVFANKDFKTFVQNAKRGDKNLPQSFSWAKVLDTHSSSDHTSIFEDIKALFDDDMELELNVMFKDLFNLIDKDQNGQMEVQEIEDAAKDSSIKEITNKYIVKHSSEWDKTENMAEKMITAVQTIPSERLEDKEQILKDLELEKQKIKNLSIFSECKSIQGFPQSDMVYVINPVGLVNEFNKECGCNTDWKNGFGRGGLDKQNKYNEYIAKASKEYNIPCLILKSLIMQESSFDEKAANTQGFAGLTQVGGPAIGEAGFNIGNTNKINGVWIYDKTGDERFDPEKSIMGGAKVLNKKRDSIITFIPSVKSLSEEEQWKYYLAGYNAGEGVIKDAYNELGKEGAKWEELTKQYPWISEKKSEAFNLTNKKLIQRNSKPRTEESWLKIVNSTLYSPLLVGLLCQPWGGEAKYTEVREYVENIIKRKNQ